MKLIIVKSSGDAGAKAASLVALEIKRKKNLILGLATGGTMIPFYRSLAGMINNKKIDMSRVRTFNLDEYVGLKRDDKQSYFYFMEKNFFSKVPIWMRNVHFLCGKAANLNLECKNYENSIRKNGGIDLQVLGIGRDGHVGFNEPGSSFRSKTREVLLSEATRRDNSRFFSSVNKVPKRALTMGIAAIMSARKIILLASGKNKAEIVHRFLHGKVSEDVPASFLLKHDNITIILDRDAASELH